MSEKRTYTNEEVIEALRVCSVGCDTCEGCPMSFEECSEDWSLLERESLAVIERLLEENKRLRFELEEAKQKLQ